MVEVGERREWSSDEPKLKSSVQEARWMCRRSLEERLKVGPLQQTLLARRWSCGCLVLARYGVAGTSRRPFVLENMAVFCRGRGDPAVLAQTLPVRPPGDVSIFRSVRTVVSIYPLSKYSVACSGKTWTGLFETPTTYISPPHSRQWTGGLFCGVSCGAWPLASQ